MNHAATRTLALLQTSLHVLRQQKDRLTDLQDIKEIHALTLQLDQTLRDAIARQLVPADPVAHVLAEWESLRKWSNRFQTALQTADGLADARMQAPAGASSLPTRSQLEALIPRLGAAPNVLRAAAETAQHEHQPNLWEGEQPHVALMEIAVAMDRVGKWTLTDQTGERANGVFPLVRPAVATYHAMNRVSDAITQRVVQLNDSLVRTRKLLEKHDRHASALAEAGRLVEQGNPAGAGILLDGIRSKFSDLDYADIRKIIVTAKYSAHAMEEQVNSFAQSVAARTDDSGFAILGKVIFILPMFQLQRKCARLSERGRKLQTELQSACTAPVGSELYQQWQQVMARLNAALGELEQQTIPRVRRWSLACAILAVLAVAGLICLGSGLLPK